MFKYFAFGLKIYSDLILPELIETDFKEYDLRILIGEIPFINWESNCLHKPIVSIDRNNFLHNLPPATYLASNGNRIIINPKKDQDLDSIRLFLYSNIFSAILHQRNNLLIHASGIVFNEKLHLFLGPSGMGKSTIVAYLEKKGLEVFSDDVIIFRLKDNELTNCQSYPQIKLWEDSFEKLGLTKSKAKKTRPELPKYGIKINKYSQKSSYPIGNLFFLNNNSIQNKVQICNLNSLEAFQLVYQNIFRIQQVSNTLDQNYVFKIISEISKNKSFGINRNFETNNIEEQMNLIITKLNNV